LGILALLDLGDVTFRAEARSTDRAEDDAATLRRERERLLRDRSRASAARGL